VTLSSFIEFGDLKRGESKLHLVTKGHGGESGERLPVLLFPFVDEIIWRYVVKYRPTPSREHKKAFQRIFLSHSVRNYGQVITSGTVRKIVDALRVRLDPPWDKRVTPHTLRHAFARDLQRHSGPFAVTANLRHRSLSSSEPYRASVEAFSEELIQGFQEELDLFLSRVGLMSLLTKSEL
jgi:site-specific recombinase XerD